jgi:hypothetical protein
LAAPFLFFREPAMGWAYHGTIEQGGTKSGRGGEILRIGQNRIFALPSGVLLARRFTVSLIGWRIKRFGTQAASRVAKKIGRIRPFPFDLPAKGYRPSSKG